MVNRSGDVSPISDAMEKSVGLVVPSMQLSKFHDSLHLDSTTYLDMTYSFFDIREQ